MYKTTYASIQAVIAPRRLSASNLFPKTRHIALSAVAASLCIACSTQDTNTTATQPLVVGNSPWPGFVAQFVAEEKGYYDDEGITVEEKHFQVSTDVNTALSSDQMDVAWTGIPDMVVMANQEPSFRLVAVSDYSDGADGILATGVNKPEDLLGKTIAWEDLPLQALLLQAYLKDTDIEIEDLDLRVMPAAEAATAFIGGRVDVAITFEPYLTNAVKEGKGDVVFSSKDTSLIAGGLVGKADTLESRREDIEAYMRALDKGFEFYENNPEEALEIVADKLELPVEELGPIMDNVRLFSPSEHSDIVFNENNPLNIMDSIEFAAEVGTDMGIVQPSVKASTLYDASYTNRL